MPVGKRTLLGLAAAAVAVLATAAQAATAPPQNTSLPTISGTAQEGHTLTAYPGTWTNSPTDYSYKWDRCDTSGDVCKSIGIFRRQYTLTAADVGHTIRLVVTAKNAGGSTSAMSKATAVVAPPGNAPANAAKPSITGEPREGSSLTASTGTWTGSQPITYTFQWNRCDQAGANCGAIAGATAATYAVTSNDVSHTLTVTVTAKNSRGTSSSTGGPTALVAPAKSGGAAVSVSTINLPDRLIVDGVKFSPNPIRTRGPVTARFHVSDTRGFAIQGALVYALGLPYGWVRGAPEVATDSSGWATITLRPTSSMPLRRGALVVFVRARKPGDSLLAGVSTRRLVQASIR